MIIQMKICLTLHAETVMSTDDKIDQVSLNPQTESSHKFLLGSTPVIGRMNKTS